jgi:MFS family permease
MILFVRAQPLETSLTGEKRTGVRGLVQRRYIQYLAVVFVAVFSMYLAIPLSQNFLQNERGINLAQMGVLFSARSVGVVLLNLTLGQLNARIGFLLTHLCMALFALLMLQGSNFYAYLVGYLLLGSYTTARSLITAQGRSLAQASNMGVAYGIIETAAASAIILASPLAGLLYAKNPTLIYSTSLILIMGALGVAIFFSPVRSRDFQLKEQEDLSPAKAD